MEPESSLPYSQAPATCLPHISTKNVVIFRNIKYEVQIKVTNKEFYMYMN